SPGPRKTGDKLIFHRVSHADRNNRDGGCCLLGCTRGRSAQCNDDIDVLFDQFVRESAQSVHVPIREFTLKRDVLPVRVTKLLQRGHKRVKSFKTWIGIVSTARRQDTYSRDRRWVLRMRGERWRRCADGNELDEIAAPHPPAPKTTTERS